MANLIRYLVKTLVWLVILIGLIAAGLRVSFANLGLFKGQIESWVATEVVPGLKFDDIRGRWNQVSPVFELDHAVISLPGRNNPIVIDTMSIEFDFWGSLIFSAPVVREISGTIEELSIRKDLQKRWWLNDINMVASQASATATVLEDLLASIPNYMHLKLDRLIIDDEISGQSHSINEIFANIETHDDATHLQLLANLPGELGTSLAVKSILRGDTGIVYLQSQQLKLAPLVALLGIPQNTAQRMEAGGEIWINLKAHHIQTITASIENITVNGNSLPALRTQLRLTGDQQPGRIEGWLEYIELQSLAELGTNHLPTEFGEKLAKLQLQGRFEDIVFSGHPGDWQSLELSARAIDVSNKNIEIIPGIDKFSADVIYARQNARVNLKAEQLALDFGEQFRAPLQIDKFHAEVRASFTHQGMIVKIPAFNAVNQDIDVAGRIWLEADPKSDAPFLFIRAAYNDGDGSQKSKYLPVKLLPPQALKWVDDGIRSAHIPNGMVMFHGRLEDIKTLETNKSGEFYAGFEVSNAEIRFDPAWETASQGNGSVLFHNLGMDIKLDSVNYADVANARAEISIPTFIDSVVQVDISAGTSTDNALRTWLATPVGAGFGNIGKSLQSPGGRVNTNIKLSIPVGNDELAERVRVKLNFDNAAIDAPSWGVKLDKISGNALVTNNTVSASGIKAEFYGDPISVDINTAKTSLQTHVKTRGLIETRHVLNLLPKRLLQTMDGKSQWRVDLTIANQGRTGNQPIVKIDASSNLQGTAIPLPAPLQKSRNLQRGVQAIVNIRANEEVDFIASYGTKMKVRGQLGKIHNQDFQLTGLDIALASIFKPKQEKGLHLYGKVSELSLNEWVEFHRSDTVRQNTGSDSMLALLRSVDLNVAELHLLDQRVDNTAFTLQQTQRGYSGSVDSSVAKGSFHFPRYSSVQNPVKLDLEFARFNTNPENNQAAGTGLVPTDMLNLQLSCKEFVYGGRSFTDLKLSTRVDNGVMQIDSLVFKRDKVKFNLTGHWLFNPLTKQHFTQLYASVKGEKFGQAIAKLNFGDIIHNGEVDFEGELSWPDELFNPQWDILSGTGKVKLENGILKDIEPGAGRFVGLLSLNALPRRLGLDFSDVFFEGMEFDDIKGDLVLDGQNLYTNNIRLDGPAAKVRVTGNTGLRERDYDQKIYVVPNIRYTLPVVGSLLAGSTGGWIFVLLQKLFKSSIEKSVEIEYRLTGSWNDPAIIAINKQKLMEEVNP
ncbi:MAG: hypothetical protein GY820_04165 [Gammaproteobacteria bacterium]|nr:hypothetical protein [Gammaproteobacteria bacterium]